MGLASAVSVCLMLLNIILISNTAINMSHVMCFSILITKIQLLILAAHTSVLCKKMIVRDAGVSCPRSVSYFVIYTMYQMYRH